MIARGADHAPRLRALGGMVVPQVAYVVGRVVADIALRW